MSRSENDANLSWVLTLASIAVVVAALYLAKGVLVPLTLAVLLSFLLSPVCDWLEHRRLGRIPAVLVTALMGFSMLGIVAWTAASQVTRLGPKIPEYKHNIELKLSSVNEYASAALRKLTKSVQGMDPILIPSEPESDAAGDGNRPYSVRVIASPSSPLQVFGGMFGTLVEVFGTAGIVIVLVVFFLLRREDLRDRFIHLVGKGNVTLTTKMLEDAGTRVSRYLSILFFVNVTFGVSVGLGLYLIGIPNAILWGILSAALRFIPYIGPWIAAAMPIGLSLAISAGWRAPILTVSLFLLLELFNNNVLEPWLYGKNTGVSAVAVLVAAVFWMWLWGPVGLLLATPLTVCLLVVGKHVPQLSFLGILLGNDPVFEPKKRIYQRLLAGDQEEAAELLDQLIDSQPLVEVYDTVLIPALAFAETHWQLGELTEGKHRFILDSLKEMIQERREWRQETAAPVAPASAQKPIDTSNSVDRIEPSLPTILSLPARNEADELSATMLAHILESADQRVQTVSVTSMAVEMVEFVEHSAAQIICISATPPAAVMHARYLCKRLRNRFPNIHLVVGLWDSQGDLDKARLRIGCDATIVSTLENARKEIRLLSESQLPLVEQTSLVGCEAAVLAGAGR